jgi:hypothetical protein
MQMIVHCTNKIYLCTVPLLKANKCWDFHVIFVLLILFIYSCCLYLSITNKRLGETFWISETLWI